MGLEPCEAHWGGQNTTAPRREAQGQDRSAAREDQACAPDYPVILPGPRCRLYYRLLSNEQLGEPPAGRRSLRLRHRPRHERGGARREPAAYAMVRAGLECRACTATG